VALVLQKTSSGNSEALQVFSDCTVELNTERNRARLLQQQHLALLTSLLK